MGTRYDLNTLTGDVKRFNNLTGFNFQFSFKSNHPFSHQKTIYFDQYYAQHTIAFVVRFVEEDIDDGV